MQSFRLVVVFDIDAHVHAAGTVVTIGNAIMAVNSLRGLLLIVPIAQRRRAAAVEIDDFKSMRANNRIEIKATIYVERESQKAIFVGKKGAAIKQLGIEARSQLADALGANIQLELVVKVKEDWSENPKDLKSFGYLEEDK